MNKVIIGYVFVAVAFLAGCQSQSNNATKKHTLDDGGATVFLPCEEPRPEMCTRQYDPVCAKHADNHHSTKSNTCSACSDASVVGVSVGECTALPR